MKDRELTIKEQQEMFRQYLSFLSSGELSIFFPDFSGDWSIDKKDFEVHWRENQKIIKRGQ